jgi:NodT family efflux transporter outer membrane factor (OMF) lipoprotein
MELSTAQLATWWGQFHDPLLSAMVSQALSQNLDLATALARVGQARAAAQAAGAQLYPTVDLTASASRQRQSLQSPLGSLARDFPGYDRNQKELSAGAVASWELDLAGGLRRGAEAASAAAEAEAAAHSGTRISVVAEVVDTYVQVRGYQARLAVADDQINTDQQLLELVKLRQRLGDADEREASQADALLKQALASVPLLRIGLEAQLNRLDVLLGQQPGTGASQLAKGSAIPEAPPVAASISPTEVLRRRPDVISAERRLAATNARIGQSLAEYYPQVSLSGALGFDSITGHHLFTSNALQPSIAGLVRWRLFDFGKIDAEVAAAKGADAEALAQYRQAVLLAAEDVENALLALTQTELRRDQLAEQVQALTRARNLSETAYKAGAIPLTDVLNANRELLFARDSLNATQASAAQAAVRVYRAIGGGWDRNSVVL